MNYKEKGNLFCKEINQLLANKKEYYALVTGGGFAYDSVKYSDTIQGDYDFMIVYKDVEQLDSLIEELEKIPFDFEKKYLVSDLHLLKSKVIDIIRLSGKYRGTKSTINLVNIELIKRIANLETRIPLKKIAHNRNTGLFFAYGSDNSRIIVNFLSPSFVSDDGEDHYIHLDFSNIIVDNNIYFGILADAILKGFNSNYDNIGFKEVRQKMIKNINNFFKNNKIDNSNYLNLYANNIYFPENLKRQLLDEFNKYGKNVFEEKNTISNTKYPIIFAVDNPINRKMKPFNFINNKSYRCSFDDYINEMQKNEYDRQYLLDALAKLFGYVAFSNSKIEDDSYIENIISKFSVYGNNDLYFEGIEKYSVNTIFGSFINDLKVNRFKYNPILYKNYLLMVLSFLSFYNNKNIFDVSLKYEVNVQELVKPELDNTKMNSEVILKLSNFDDIGMYHNYTSKVMPGYTQTECGFLEKVFIDKKEPVLDVMCGYGRIANELVKRNYKNVYGVDFSDYSFLNVDKDFIFSKDDFFHYQPGILFKYLYSLYNCYENKDYLRKVIAKMTELSADNAFVILDVFNKEWRDKIDSEFYKLLFDSSPVKLEISRHYDDATGIETTKYLKTLSDNEQEVYSFSQKFFTQTEIEESIDYKKWDIDFLTSDVVGSRNNNQKRILVLKRR